MAPRNRKLQEEAIASARRIQFQTSRNCLIVFLFWVTSLHIVGLFFFTRGFLLTRLILDDQSTCNTPPTSIDRNPDCWYPKQFSKAIIIVIDALRYDFTIPEPDSDLLYLNALTLPFDITQRVPRNAALYKFIADPPTTTLQRLKGLTTGTLPTFIDAGSNFAGTAITEDNIIQQLLSAGRKIAFLGDDTWTSLYPLHFDVNMTHPYDSFNVWDLHTLDNGVNKHIFPLLEDQEWDVLIAHYLGVDHAGHRYGPDHPEMRKKLIQMNQVLENIVKKVDKDTILLVMGDHGMDPRGDHGGDSQGEIEAALWMYSPKPFIGSSNLERTVDQIDIVPTLSLLLGLPVPFNNLGSPIIDVFLEESQSSWRNVAHASRITASQVKRYLEEYARIKGQDIEHRAMRDWALADSMWNETISYDFSDENKNWRTPAEAYLKFLRNNLEQCRRLWAEFNPSSMNFGLGILLSSILTCGVYCFGIEGQAIELVSMFLQRIGLGATIGCIFSIIAAATVFYSVSILTASLAGYAIGSLLAFASTILSIRRRLRFQPNFTFENCVAVLVFLIHAILFTSNSFTIWEDRILTFLIATLAVSMTLAAYRESIAGNVSRYSHGIIFLVLSRIASYSRVCREEQSRSCKTTFYASDLSTTTSPQTVLGLFIVFLILPRVIRRYLVQSGSWEGGAKPWIGLGLPLGLVMVVAYWALDAADNNGWLSNTDALGFYKISLARTILGYSLIAANYGWFHGPHCLDIKVNSISKVDFKADDTPSLHDSDLRVQIQGRNNAYGSFYLLFVVNSFIALALLSKPMAGISLAILLYQILALLELNQTAEKKSYLPVVVMFGLLAHSHFFSTGHQATLPSIQWDTAFIPSSEIVYPFSPMIIIANTYSAHILTSLCLPLVGLWRQQSIGPYDNLENLGRIAILKIFYHAIISTSATIWAAHFRRHLMVWKVFAPRYMMGGISLLVVDLTTTIISFGIGVSKTFKDISEIFGY
ncbi:GPI ethanolamine phosphate transferase 3 [Neolecta irregularis DAH-3]|uniref:GPI ethanolamine phosphate transferase 3 n=1 Tax=Neolecta irregularis (strain DAH-3) TaxID=1198029 RepID=A0A1U7LSX7_NEOID|nr:GPI ethanolamine phosphate transferase 3 [Neolecta irregularis DAH-3]|eukprot:OLL25767.1 GPI ethanolamine phosphate transferase 3 [Neolecta irregularis DAH-3]